MSLSFPPSPAVSDRYTFNFRTWVWNGSGWQKDLTQGMSGGFTAPRVYMITPNIRPMTYTTYVYI